MVRSGHVLSLSQRQRQRDRLAEHGGRGGGWERMRAVRMTVGCEGAFYGDKKQGEEQIKVTEKE